MKVNKVRYWVLGIVLLLQVLPSWAQAPRKGNKNSPAKPPVDTIVKLPSPALLLAGNGCTKGITDILIEFAPLDTSTVSPVWIYIYRVDDAEIIHDTIPHKDTIHLYRVSSVEDIEKNKWRLYIDKPGQFFVKTAAGKATNPVFSKSSDTVAARFCSQIEFHDAFNRATDKVYIPGPFINIQIQEFDIFDRIGNPAYSHKNNDIRWDGTYPNHTPCPAGVYYYHCTYIDLTDENADKKSLSGMIELKN